MALLSHDFMSHNLHFTTRKLGSVNAAVLSEV